MKKDILERSTGMLRMVVFAPVLHLVC